MPLYEYLCVTCGNFFEHLVRSSANAEPVVCPKCGGAQVNKQFSTFSARAGGGSLGGNTGDAACSTGGG